MKKYFLMMLVTASTISCAQESPKVKKVQQPAKKDFAGIKVVNADDPVCHMKTADYLTDTVKYKNKIYGFCSISCKNEFKKSPQKYANK